MGQVLTFAHVGVEEYCPSENAIPDFKVFRVQLLHCFTGEQKVTQVVRLSTKSYVQDVSFTEKKGKDGFVTVWMWFWKDNDGWKMYGAVSERE